MDSSPYKSPDSFLDSIQPTKGSAVSATSPKPWLLVRGLLILLCCAFLLVTMPLLVFLFRQWLAGQLYPSAKFQLVLLTQVVLMNIFGAVLLYATIGRRLSLAFAAGLGCCSVCFGFFVFVTTINL